jgi:hypothetical protein
MPEHRGDRHSRFPERHRQDPLAAPPARVDGLVGGERCGYTADGQGRYTFDGHSGNA